MSQAVFLTGWLSDPVIQAAVFGEELEGRAAALAGHVLRCAGALQAPGLVAQDGAAAVEGCLVALEATARARLVLFCALSDQHLQDITVICDGRPCTALAAVPTAPATEDAAAVWRPDAWSAEARAFDRALVTRLVALADHHALARVQLHRPMLLAALASERAADAAHSPARLRGDWTRDDVEIETESQPYLGFFTLREDRLRFRRFDGSLSPTVHRAGFVMSDAVTLLPYDPVTDCVLVIEQFRFGPWLRGARNCWSIEPIAGRVDPGERPEVSALREAREEARLELREDHLRAVGNCYPSPGAVSEYLHHFVGLCALDRAQESVAGLEAEAEDIRSHVIPFAQLLEMIETGEVENGPLLLTAYWLGMHRARLRAEGYPHEQAAKKARKRSD